MVEQRVWSAGRRRNAQRGGITPGVIIDAHTHILPDKFRQDTARFIQADATFAELFARSVSAARTASADDLVASMDANGVSFAIAAGYGWTDAGVASVANDYTLEAARSSAGRIIPFASVNPVDGEKAALEVRRCAEAGARGIGELHPDTQGFADVPSGIEKLAALMDVARAYSLPVLVHVSEPVGHLYAGKGTFTPEKALVLAARYPQNVFIFAHLAGGLPFYSHMPEVRDSIRNVWVDTAAQPLLYDPSVYCSALATPLHNRLLFASDFPLVSQGRALAQASKSGMPGQAAAAVLGQNAAELFGISAGASYTFQQ